MTSANVIDIDALLKPIEGDSPTGSNIRDDASASSIYYKIKDARGGARNSERKLLMEDDPESANVIVPEWNTVLETAPEILTSHAKDLEVVAWYTEGLLRHYGLAGLRDGFRLIHGLVENFWDGLYPMPDEDGIETRVAPLIGLNGEGGEGTLMIPINKVPLTEENSYPAFATWNYEQALDLEKITEADKKAARIAAGAVALETIQQAANETDPDFINTFKSDLDECIDAFTKMTVLLDEKCGQDSPPSSNIRNRLNRLKEIMGFLSKNTPAANKTAPQASTNENTTAATPTTSAASAPAPANNSIAVSSTGISSREEAHKIMLQIAQYFRDTEPHSPVSYALEQAVRWGKMSLPDLLSELISDERSRQDLFTTTGIPYESKKRK